MEGAAKTAIKQRLSVSWPHALSSVLHASRCCTACMCVAPDNVILENVRPPNFHGLHLVCNSCSASAALSSSYIQACIQEHDGSTRQTTAYPTRNCSCMLCCLACTIASVPRHMSRLQTCPGDMNLHLMNLHFQKMQLVLGYMQVCATIGLCDTHQIPTPARKLLAQTLMQAQQTQQDQIPSEVLRQIIPAEQRTAQRVEQVGESSQCQICEMAVNYVKVRMLTWRRCYVYQAQRTYVIPVDQTPVFVTCWWKSMNLRLYPPRI